MNKGIKTFFSSRTEALAGILFSRLPDADSRRKNPFHHTHIVVPNSGMKRYLELSIAEHFGICSHINIDFASRFLDNCYRQVLPNEQRQKYINIRQLTFAILSLWQDHTDNLPDTLQQLLNHHQTQRQRYDLAEQIANLFNQYLNERPELIVAWQLGKTLYQHPHENWQMQLFEQLQLGQFAGNELQHRFHQTLSCTDNDKPINLPSVHLFGFHSIPPVQLADFSALSVKTDVNAYIFNPSITYWRDIVPISVKAEKLLTAENEADLMTTGNPLLSAWGQSGKYLLEELNNDTIPLNVDEAYQLPINSVLTWLQNEVRQGDEITDTDNLQKIAEQEITDNKTKQKPFSLSLHIAASPRREVEILYDNLCKQFEQGDLNPSDVLVMMPNLRDYAPHIESVFGAQPQQKIPFSLANQTAAEADPDTQTFLALLTLIDSDFSAQALFDVIGEKSIRQQFHLSVSDVQTIHYWLIESRTAKGFYDDSLGRADSLEKLLDALLLAMIGGQDCQVDTDNFNRLALPSYASGQKDSLIGLSRFLHLFTPFSQLKTQQKTITAWRDILLLLANNFLGESNTVAGRLQQWHDEIITDKSDDGLLSVDKLFAYDSVITDVISLLESDELHGPFLSGGISFCAMVPMRSIPSKMICLLGLNQKFPHIVSKNPLDLRHARPLWSDRNINKEYRYFFLETLMATREQLYLSYVGKDDKTGKTTPPSILVEDLLNFIKKYHSDYTDKISNDYPLQGFLHHSGTDSTYQPLFIAPEPDKISDKISTDIHKNEPIIPTQFSGNQLARYLAEPMQLYLNRYLSVTPIALPDKTLAEHHTVALESGLDKWAFNNAALNKRLFNTDNRDSLIQANRYPPETISQTLLQHADDYIKPLSDTIKDFIHTDNHSYSQFIQYDNNEKTFSLLWECPRYNEQGQWTYQLSAINGSKLIRLWVSHVLMNNIKGLPDYHSHLFTMEKGNVTQTTLSPLENSKQALQQLLALFEYLFSTPIAVSLELAPKKSGQVFCYKNKDYPLYPRLMLSVKNTDDEVLQQHLSAINDYIHNHYQQVGK